jgi:AcrR family transcriptional regulator
MTKEERKLDILRVAAEVFTQRGYRPTTIDALVEAAGISKGLFYIYFDSKKQAFIELIESFFEGFAAVLEENHRHLEEAFASRADVTTILTIWRDNILRILKYHFDNPNLTFVVYQEALGSDEDFSERVNELSEHASKMVAEEFKMMAESGALRTSDVELVADVTMGSVVYVIMDFLLRKKWTDIDSLADKLLDYHARALTPQGVDIDRVLQKLLLKKDKKKVSREAS